MRVLPTTVDGVVNELDDVITESIKTNSRLGYFAALYRRMTMAIRDGINAGQFQDAARIEAVDVAFAGRYLAARQQYLAGELQGQAWLQAYQAATEEKYSVLQQLLIAINPHIMIDLGVAVARTCPGAELEGFKQDFGTINSIISGLMPIVDAELDQLSPLDRVIDHTIGKLKNAAINACIDEGRTSSWDFASSLAFMDLDAQCFVIGARDLRARVLGDLILDDPIATLAKKKDSADIAENIRVLSAAPAPAPPQTPQTSSRQP
jgi:hypothetical protein